MGYHIQYNPEENQKYPVKPVRAVRSRWLIGAALVAVLVLGLVGLDGGSLLKTWLLPGDPVVTEAAFSVMVEDIRAGESVKDAITTFCLEIIENAENHG